MSTLLKGAFALALAVPCTVAGQVLGGRVTASGGMDAVLYDGSKYVPGYVAQLGLDWRVGQRGSLRLGLMHYQQNRTDTTLMAGCIDQCITSRKYGLSGLTFDGTFDLTKGRLRPYLLSGVGLYRSNFTSATNFHCTLIWFASDGCTYGVKDRFTGTAWAGGLHSGIGFSMPFRNLTLFTEGRIAIVAATQANRTNNPRGLIPITFGVKF